MKTLNYTEKIAPYWQPFTRRWLPGTIVLISVFSLGIISTLMKKPVYEARAKLKFTKSDVVSSITETAKIDNKTAVSAIAKTIDELKLKDTTENPLSISDFRKNFFLRKTADTNIFELGYRDSDPELAAKVTNTLVANYLNSNIALARSHGAAASQFLEQQLSTVKQNIEQTETAIVELRETNRLFSPQDEASTVTTTLQEVRQKLIGAKAEVANLESQAEYISKQLGLNSENPAAITVLRSPEIQAIVLQLQALTSERAIATALSGENNSRVREVESQIESLQNLLERRFNTLAGSEALDLAEGNQYSFFQPELASKLVNLEADIIGLTNQIAYLSEVERDWDGKAQQLPQVERQLRELNRQLTVSQYTYELLSEQYQAVGLVENLNSGNLQVITYATTPKKPQFSRSWGYLTAAGLAVVAATGVIYLLETSDRRIKTIEAAQQIFGCGWLGIIPDIKHLDLTAFPEAREIKLLFPERIVKDFPALPVSESYRLLQTNFKFLSSNRQIKSAIVTSSVSQEGKSTVAANLATALARVGDKVLLVDANLHYPTQHLIWDVFREDGLSNILSENLDPRLAVKVALPNLDLITSGTKIDSPGTLLDLPKMKLLIDYWADYYDFIIIDSPALNLAADAAIISRIVDGTLLVVKPEAVNRTEAKLTEEILAKSGQNVLGLVVNAVNSEAKSRSYYHHALKALKKEQSSSQLMNSSKQELWETVSRLAAESERERQDRNITSSNLYTVPPEKMLAAIAKLERDLLSKTQLVKEQEEELFLQRQKIKKLRVKVNLADEKDRWDWQVKLAQERELERMLAKTLDGQLNNLKRKQRVLERYRRALSSQQQMSV